MYRQAPVSALTPKMMARGAHPDAKGGDVAILIYDHVGRDAGSEGSVVTIIAEGDTPDAEVAVGCDVECRFGLRFRNKIEALLSGQASHAGRDDSAEQRQAEAQGPGLNVCEQQKARSGRAGSVRCRGCRTNTTAVADFRGGAHDEGGGCFT